MVEGNILKMTRFKTDCNIHALDSDWQFPAVTEQHAYHRIRDLGGLPDGFTYVAFPWATLIDKLERKAVGLDELRDIFKKFRQQLPTNTIKITVCQHIKCHNFMYLFHQAGIDHLFWSHAELDSCQKFASKYGVTIHPFPLYPVQLPSDAEAATTDRAHLFSFVGAKANQWYMTQARTWILEYLKDLPGGFVIGRDTWHYNKVVYDHQVTGKSEHSAELVNAKASEEFKKMLLNTVFSLCPSGTGPNSIRLWESMGAGAIPVILADTHLLPGNMELWKQAVVFCEETPKAIKALPARLEKIAQDPEALQAMRQALRQLWMLYGRDGFGYDIQRLVIELASQQGVRHPLDSTPKSSEFLDDLLASLAGKIPLTKEDSLLLLKTCVSYLLLGSHDVSNRFQNNTPLRRAANQARATLGKEHPAVILTDKVLEYKPRSKLASPSVSTGAKPKVFLYGKHSHRTPLAYAPYRQLVGDALDWAGRAEDADLLIAGYTLDLRENSKALDALRHKKPELKCAVISEEPLWDTIWSQGFTARERTVGKDGNGIPFTFLNHQTSDIFAFDKLPYFITTDDKFFLRYQSLLLATSQRTAREWQDIWQAAALRYAFFAEVRENRAYDQAWKNLDVYGLSCYRTDVAQLLKNESCITVGQGWSTAVPRQKLVDWHLDKLTTLQERVAIVSGLENTHQKHYISEKIFDSFAVGGIPIYHASPNHRIFDLVRDGSFINCYDKTPKQGAEAIRGFRPDAEFLEAYVESQAKLATLFRDPRIILSERHRVTRAVLKEIEQIC